MARPRELIIAIDGPSGAGKSTLSKLLAQCLNYVNIDTGAMYRAVALAAKCRGISPDDQNGLAELSRSLRIGFRHEEGKDRVFLNDRDVSEAIRDPEISILTSRVATVPSVRRAMVDLQRQLGKNGGVVLEGRDIGTVVFPGAEVKFFLQASSSERGRRRYEELKEKGVLVDLEQTISEVKERDRADAGREHSPLRKAPDARVIDTDGIPIEAVLEKMLEVVSACRKKAGLPVIKGVQSP